MTIEEFNKNVVIEPYDGPMVGDTSYRAKIMIGGIECSVTTFEERTSIAILFLNLKKEGYIEDGTAHN